MKKYELAIEKIKKLEVLSEILDKMEGHGTDKKFSESIKEAIENNEYLEFKSKEGMFDYMIIKDIISLLNILDENFPREETQEEEITLSYDLEIGVLDVFTSETNLWAKHYNKKYARNIEGLYFEINEDIDLTEEAIETIAILNTTIATADGEYSLKTISLEETKEILKDKNILSAIGHESTAQILTQLLNREVNLNRIEFTQNVNQKAICFKLKGRPKEGQILSLQELEKIGYEFKLLTRLS